MCAISASGQNAFMEFIKEDNVNQLFILPFEFKDKETKTTFLIDATFTDTVSNSSWIPVNFSVISKDPVENFNKVLFGPDGTHEIRIEKVMFEEPYKRKKTLKRYNGKLKVSSIKTLYAEDCKVNIPGKKEITLEPHRKSLKKLESINLILEEYLPR